MARYRGPSDASVAISGIMSGLAAVERQYRYDAREKDKFRESVILQERKLQYAGEQSRADRELRKFEFQWRTLTDDKKIALDKLEALEQKRSELGIADSEWQSMEYMNQTGDFKDIIGAAKDDNDSKVNNAVFNYENTDKQIKDLMSDVNVLQSNIRVSKRLNEKISQMSAELGAELPEFYATYKDVTVPKEGEVWTEDEKMRHAFTLDPDEQSKVFGELAKLRPDMFGDISTNETLAGLVRREISTLYSPAIQRATELETLKNARTNQIAQEEAVTSGDYQKLVESTANLQQINLIQMGENFQVRVFQPEEQGIAEANKAIKKFSQDFSKVPGVPKVQAQALADLIVQEPGKQYLGFGAIMKNAFDTLAFGGTKKEMEIAELTVKLLEKHKIYGYMDPDAQEKFIEAYDDYKVQGDILKSTLRQHGQYLQDKLNIGNSQTPPPAEQKTIIDTAAAANAIGLNLGVGYGVHYDPRHLGMRYGSDEEDDALDSTTINLENAETDSTISDTLDLIETVGDSNKVSTTDLIINNTYETGDSTGLFTDLPMFGDTSDPPDFMEGYEFAGYTEPGAFGIGGGEPMYRNKETGVVSSVPIEMQRWTVGESERQKFWQYEAQLEADYKSAAGYRDLLQDLEDVNAKMDRVTTAFGEGHPRRMQRVSQLENERMQIQNALNAMEMSSPKFTSLKKKIKNRGYQKE